MQRSQLHELPVGDSLLIDGILGELEATISGEPLFDPGIPERLGRVIVDVYGDLDGTKAEVSVGINMIELLDRARDAISKAIEDIGDKFRII